MNMNSINISAKITPQLQQKLSFAPGQIIKAVVKKAESNQIMLQVGDNLIKAETKIPLKTGEQLKLQVQAAQNNLIELKIINENDMIKQDDSVFIRLGLKPGKEMENIIQQFAKFNIPVSQPALSEIYSLMKKYNLTEDLTQLMVWLKSVGVKAESPKDIQTLKTLHKFLAGNLSADQESHFINFLNGTENNCFGGYNMFCWQAAEQHVYLLTQESKHRQLHPETCKLFLQVNSRSCADIWFKMELNNNNLKTSIICSGEQYKTILNRETGLLSQALQTAGYQVDKISVSVCAENITILDLIPDSDQQFIKIDIEV